MAPRKRNNKKISKKKSHTLRLSIIFAVILLLFGGIFLTYSYFVRAAARYEIHVVNPEIETVRGGPLAFYVTVFDQAQGENLSTGIKYDKRKLRLDRIESGQVGEIQRENLADEGNESRMVLRTTSTSASNATGSVFATIHFTVIDQTNERDAQGRGFTEICTLFDAPNSNQPTPTTTRNQPSQNPTNRPITGSDNQPTTPPDQQPTRSTTQPPIDTSLSCIPLSVKGTPDQKMDIVVIGANYTPQQFNLFVEDATYAVASFNRSNLRNYRSEVLDKMNWYALNPSTYENQVLSLDAAIRIGMGRADCARDRFLILDNDPESYPGRAMLGLGANVNIQFEKEYGFPVIVHEWGHFAGSLADEYEITYDPSYAQSAMRAPNCSDRSSQGEQTACPKWDCTKVQCTALMQELFENIGCYRRCGHADGYRSTQISMMDSHDGSPGTLNFNPPSLVHLIEEVFDTYD